MAVDLTEGTAFAPVVTVPQPGDLRKSASVDLPFQQLTDRTRFIRDRLRPMIDVTRYGADSTGASSSQTAFASAIAIAAALGGDVYVPPGNFLITGLNVPGGVNIWGTSESYVYQNHATNNLIHLTGGTTGPANIISDLRFIGNISNNGIGVLSDADAKVVFQRCAWNGDDHGSPSALLVGKLAYVTSASSELSFYDCELRVAGTVKGLHATAGKVRVVGGKMVMPATYSDSLAYAEATARVTLDRVYADLTAHTTGVGQVLYAATNDASAFSAMRDCEIEALGAAGTLTAFYWSPDANVVMTGNRLSATGVAPFGQFSAPSARSIVELRPYVQQDFSTSALIDLRNTYGYRTHLVRNDANVVSIILPAGVIDGQELDFIYDSEALVTAGNLTFATTKISAAAVPLVGAGSTLTGHFRWAQRLATGDSDRWIQVGTWGVGTVLV